jgi:Tfp pilus assembly protein PilF
MSFRRALPALLLAALAPAALHAQADKLPAKEITEKTSGSLGELRTLTETKDYTKAIALIDQLIAAAPAGSYDIYVLSQVKAQVLLTQDKLVDAIVPVETALALAEGNPNFLDPAARLEQLNLVAQLHYQKGAADKTPEGQRAGFLKALSYLDRWFKLSPKPSAQTHLFAASIQYNLATLGTGAADVEALRAALAHCEEAMLLSPKPTAQLRLLQIACHLQLGQNARAAELLEVLAEVDPKTSSTWSQVQALYLNLAADAKDPAQVQAMNLRALHVIDRAQSHGHLSTPKDNYTRVAILFNLGQYSLAAQLLEAGLADGKIEPTQRNWELLASAYQQSDQQEKALDTYARAVARFPAQADLEFSLAQSLYAAGKIQDAYGRARSAVAKPGLSKPGQTKLYLAFLAYELQQMDEAQTWVDQARASGDVPAASLDPLARAVSEAIKAREALKNS